MSKDPDRIVFPTPEEDTAIRAAIATDPDAKVQTRQRWLPGASMEATIRERGRQGC